MMIKITERCTMSCSHCMNNATSDGRDMSIEIFRDTLEFLRRNNLGKMLIISGGEPTEHRDFDTIMKTLFDFQKKSNYFKIITITTNGELISKDPNKFKDYVRNADDLRFKLMFQVSADVRYYPRRIQTHKRIFREEGFVLCDDCVEKMYPIGRAVENGYKWDAKASKCFNVRAISKQIAKEGTLGDIERILGGKMKFCTPHIKFDGGIGLGESDLCPKCASIYDSMEDIMKSIRGFDCRTCDMINKNLAPEYKMLLNPITQ